MNEQSLMEHAVIHYRPLPEDAGIMRLLVTMLRSLRPRDVLLILFATAMLTLVGALYPMASNLLYNRILVAHKSSLLPSALFIFLGIVVVGTMFAVIKNVLLAGIRIRMSVMTESAFFGRCLSLPVGFYRENPPGQVAEWMSEIPKFCENFADLVFGTWFSSLLALLYVVQIGLYAPSMLPFSVLVVAALCATSLLIAAAKSRWTRRQLLSNSRLTETLYDLFYGVEKIKLNDARDEAWRIWFDRYREVSRYTYEPPVYVRLGTVFPALIAPFASVASLLAAKGAGLTAGEYVVFYSAFGMILGAAIAAGQTADILAAIKPQYDLLSALIVARPEYLGDEGASLGKLERLDIEVRGLSFAYPDGKEVLHDLSLAIPQGDYVAIVGSTGCGKSTLLRLILGFEQPTSGAVLVNGVDLRRLNLMDVRQAIGVVLQHDRLFPGSILDNMRMANPGVSEDDVWKALRTAGMERDVRAMPMGLHTHIGERSYFSGGQNQRLQIARAILGEPKVLIMDEATSALDNETQARVAEALDGMDCTRIVVAHRLSTIKNARRIVVLDGGRVKEEGTYEDLMRRREFFYELVSRQLYGDALS